jgi:3-hydroxyacyl-CoA dehydrogenase/enoyl-CoA hydratase/3-hydroxybutyryl-CoA epimerase
MLAKGWLGRKSRKGFYEYGSGAKEWVNPQLTQFQPAEPSTVDESELRDRLVLVMVNEAARCLAEGVVQSPADVDFAMTMGTGWAPFRGGPLQYADSIGISGVVSKLNGLRDRVGQHFEPCPVLIDMANGAATFFPHAESVSSPVAAN